MDTSRNRGALLGFMMVFATLVVNAAITYLNLRHLERYNALVNESREILLELETLVGTVVAAESAERGYLITADRSYLDPYNAAVNTIPDSWERLRQLTIQDEEQQERLQQMKMLIDERLERLQAGIDLRDAQGLEAAIAYLGSGQGKQLTDNIRSVAIEFENQERRLLSKRDEEARVSYWTALISGFITAALGIGLVAVSYLLVTRDIARQEDTTLAMQQTMETLEQRVRERTLEISDANAFLRAEVIERRRAEDQANLFAQELQRSNRELEQFASVASHDLQEPLRKIQAFGDRLRAKFRDQLGDQGRDYLDRMLASAARMRKLIDDLLTFSRVATKAQPFTSVNLQQVAEEVVSDLEPRLHQTGGRIEVGELPTIEAEPLQMRQLFQNLLVNALKFHRAGVPPEVSVSARLVDEPLLWENSGNPCLQCQLVFEDNGIGFEPVYADRIFELFQRLHGRNDYEGTGMGLAICRKIVDRHGGHIAAESTPGEGARFIVTLPLVQSAVGVAP